MEAQRGSSTDFAAALRQGDTAARCKAAAALGKRGDDAAWMALFEALDGRDEAVRACVVAALRSHAAAAAAYAVAEGSRRDAALRGAMGAAKTQPGDAAAKEASSAATFVLGQHLRRVGALDHPALLPLIDLAQRPDQPTFVRSGASWCVSGQSWSVMVQTRLRTALIDREKDVRWPAADGLARKVRDGDAATRQAASELAAELVAQEKDAGVKAKLQQAATQSAVGPK